MKDLKEIDLNNLSDCVTRISELYNLTITETDEGMITAHTNYPDDVLAEVVFELREQRNTYICVKVRGQGVQVGRDYTLKYHTQFSLYELTLLATADVLYRFEDYLLRGETKVA